MSAKTYGTINIGTLATTAERRVVIINHDTNGFCAEPPADAADNLTSSFAAALKGTDANVTASAEISKAFASSIKQLFKRSQGVQLYRDGMYSLCQAFINKAISSSQFSTMQADLLKESSTLIGKELQYLQYLTIDNASLPIIPVPPKLGKGADTVEPSKAQ
jgi:hypothetical protein